MRKFFSAIISVVLSAILASGQGSLPTPPIATSQIAMPVFNVNPTPATGAALSVVGNPGPRTDYYWISANYLVGNASLAGPFPITSAPNTRSVSNYVTINPSFSSAGVLSYDVLRTTTPTAPTGACNCAVATAVAVGTITNDQTGALNSYTVTPFNIAVLGMTIDNEVQSAGVSHLILRQNGTLVCDLSTACGNSGGGLPSGCSVNQLAQYNGTTWVCATISISGVTGTGTATFVPAWSAASVLTNSFFTSVFGGSTGTINCPAACLNYFTLSGQTVSSVPGGSIQMAAGNNTGAVNIIPGGGNQMQVSSNQVAGSGGVSWVQVPSAFHFANLATSTAPVGSVLFCEDCAEGTNPCTTSGGTGSGTFAFLIEVPLGTKWKCL